MEEVVLRNKKAIKSDWGKLFYYRSASDKTQAQRLAIAHESLMKQNEDKKPRKKGRKKKTEE